MIRIINQQGQVVPEHRLGFFEGHPVLPEVRPGLGRIPFELDVPHAPHLVCTRRLPPCRGALHETPTPSSLAEAPSLIPRLRTPPPERGRDRLWIRRALRGRAPSIGTPTPVQSFTTFTGDLQRLAEWLTTCRVTHVAMEATGVYWIPVFEILEARGFEVILVNARHVKNVPGRKSDVSDCEWLRDLHIVGLLRGSFRPADAIVALRGYLRHRETLIESAGTHVQRMQKALVQMNVPVATRRQRHHGRDRPAHPARHRRRPPRPAPPRSHRDYRCRASEAEIVAALTGHYRAEHVFVLQQNLDLFDAYQQQLTACDVAIEAHLATARRPRCAPRRRRCPLHDAGRSRARTNPASTCGRPFTSSRASICRKSTALAPTTPSACSRKSART